MLTCIPAFGVHAHQPVGNFPEVLMDAHLRCYNLSAKCFIVIGFLFRSPFSDWLLDYLIEHYRKTCRCCGKWFSGGKLSIWRG